MMYVLWQTLLIALLTWQCAPETQTRRGSQQGASSSGDLEKSPNPTTGGDSTATDTGGDSTGADSGGDSGGDSNGTDSDGDSGGDSMGTDSGADSGGDTTGSSSGGDPELKACGDLPHGTIEERDAWRKAEVSNISECDDIEKQSRACNDGEWSEWSGTDPYQALSCKLYIVSSCGEEGAEETRERYNLKVVVDESKCMKETQTRKCEDGMWTNWSGTYQYKQPCEPVKCIFGQEPRRKTWYKSETVTLPATCEEIAIEKTRLCQEDHTWGSWQSDNPEAADYKFRTCEPVPAMSCSDGDVTVENGESIWRVRFEKNRVESGQSCEMYKQDQERECIDGQWSEWKGNLDAYKYDSCIDLGQLDQTKWGAFSELSASSDIYKLVGERDYQGYTKFYDTDGVIYEVLIISNKIYVNRRDNQDGFVYIPNHPFLQIGFGQFQGIHMFLNPNNDLVTVILRNGKAYSRTGRSGDFQLLGADHPFVNNGSGDYKAVSAVVLPNGNSKKAVWSWIRGDKVYNYDTAAGLVRPEDVSDLTINSFQGTFDKRVQAFNKFLRNDGSIEQTVIIGSKVFTRNNKNGWSSWSAVSEISHPIYQISGLGKGEFQAFNEVTYDADRGRTNTVQAVIRGNRIFTRSKLKGGSFKEWESLRADNAIFSVNNGQSNFQGFSQYVLNDTHFQWVVRGNTWFFRKTNDLSQWPSFQKAEDQRLENTGTGTFWGTATTMPPGAVGLVNEYLIRGSYIYKREYIVNGAQDSFIKINSGPIYDQTGTSAFGGISVNKQDDGKYKMTIIRGNKFYNRISQ